MILLFLFRVLLAAHTSRNDTYELRYYQTASTDKHYPAMENGWYPSGFT